MLNQPDAARPTSPNSAARFVRRSPTSCRRWARPSRSRAITARRVTAAGRPWASSRKSSPARRTSPSAHASARTSIYCHSKASPLPKSALRLRRARAAPPRRAQGQAGAAFLWAHWCGDCKAQSAVLGRVLQKYRPRGLVVIAPTRFYGRARRTSRRRPPKRRRMSGESGPSSTPARRRPDSDWRRPDGPLRSLGNADLRARRPQRRGAILFADAPGGG